MLKYVYIYINIYFIIFLNNAFCKHPQIIVIYFEKEIIAIIVYAKYVAIIVKQRLLLKQKSCDNRNNHIQQKATIVFHKLKTPFSINPIPRVHVMVWFGLSAFLTVPVCYYQRRLQLASPQEVIEKQLNLLFILQVFFVFTIFMFRKARFFRNLGSFVKLRNSSLIFAKYKNRFVASFAKFSRNEISSKTLNVNGTVVSKVLTAEDTIEFQPAIFQASLCQTPWVHDTKEHLLTIPVYFKSL